MKRDKFEKFRVDDEEKAKLKADADAAGLSKSDFIREKLGWPRHGAPVLPPSERTKETIGAPAEGPPADPAKEPGKAAIEELAKRIHGSEGVPMRVASQRAKERLTN